MCFNRDSTNLSLICYFTIILVNGTNEYFLTTYYIWQKHTKEHTKEPNTKEPNTKDKYKHEEENREDKSEVARLPKQHNPKYRVFY
jgi:hypothetical protein